MTVTFDMTVLAVLALVAGIAGILAPRFLGMLVGAALLVFGVVELFPGITEVDVKETLGAIELDGLQFEDGVPPARATGEAAGRPG